MGLGGVEYKTYKLIGDFRNYTSTRFNIYQESIKSLLYTSATNFKIFSMLTIL